MKPLMILTAVALVFGAAAVWAGKGRPEGQGPFVVRFPLGDSLELDAVLPRVKARGIIFAGPASTAWGEVRAVQRACVKAGIDQVEWAVGDQLLKIPLAPDHPAGFGKVRLEDIAITLHREHVETVRRVGERRPVESDEDLARLILSMKMDQQRAGRSDFPVAIDSDRDVPWGDVIRVVTLCRLTGFEDIDLDPPSAAIYNTSARNFR